MSRRCCAKNCFNTIITNKNVQYFGFPKSEEFAKKWATAAGRDDLLDKPLNNIIKYYLCSSHFTDDCFTDATNTQLKKQSRPTVIVPVPSIFVNNITQFIPDALKDNICIELCEYVPPSPEKRPHEEEEESSSHKRLCDSYQEQQQGEPIHLYLRSDNDMNEYILAEGAEISYVNQCRLCANTFKDTELLPIFTDQNIMESIERLLPETVFPEDGKPQQICHVCYDRMGQCLGIIDSFNIAQAKFD